MGAEQKLYVIEPIQVREAGEVCQLLLLGETMLQLETSVPGIRIREQVVRFRVEWQIPISRKRRIVLIGQPDPAVVTITADQQQGRVGRGGVEARQAS